MMIRTLSTLSLLALLAACGGGGGPRVEDPQIDDDPSENLVQDDEAPSSDGIPDNPGQTFDDNFGTEDPDDEDPSDGSELDDTLSGSEERRITLTGIAFVRPGSGSANLIETREGTFTESTGTRTLDGELIVLNGDIAGTFTQASSYSQDVNDEVGIIGIATEAAAMPTSGQATFNGGATGLVVIGDNGFDLRNGDSTVAIDFENGTLDATLDNFTSVSIVSDNLANAPFDTILLSDALIEATGFVGGVVSTAGGDTLADVVGDNATALSRGQFFGTNEAGTSPTELGGVVFAEGDSGLVFGSFIAAGN